MAGARPCRALQATGRTLRWEPSEGSEQRTTWTIFCFRGVIPAALLRIDGSGGSKGRETREEPTAISRQERDGTGSERGGRLTGSWTYFQVEPTGFAVGRDIGRGYQQHGSGRGLEQREG